MLLNVIFYIKEGGNRVRIESEESPCRGNREDEEEEGHPDWLISYRRIASIVDLNLGVRK